MQDVTPEIMNEIVRRLVAEFDPEMVILFGSRAWGIPREDSDVDLLVVVSHTEESELEMAMRAHRCMRGIPVPMDLIVKTRKKVDRFARVYASLEAEILERGKVLYGRSEVGTSPELANDPSFDEYEEALDDATTIVNQAISFLPPDVIPTDE